MPLPVVGSHHVRCCRFLSTAISGTDKPPVAMLVEDYESHFYGFLSLCRHFEFHHFPKRRDAHMTLVWGRLHNTGGWCNSAGCSMMCCDTAQAGNPSAHRSLSIHDLGSNISPEQQYYVDECKVAVQMINQRRGVMLPLSFSEFLFHHMREDYKNRWRFFARLVLTQRSNSEGQHEGGFIKKIKKKKKKSLQRHENLEAGWWCPMSCPGVPPKSPRAPPPPPLAVYCLTATCFVPASWSVHRN